MAPRYAAPIPKGLRLKAQGCEERATLGWCGNEHRQPQRGCAPIRNGPLTRTTAHDGRNPVGVVNSLPTFSQGSSFLATLGFEGGIPLGFE